MLQSRIVKILSIYLAVFLTLERLIHNGNNEQAMTPDYFKNCLLSHEKLFKNQRS